MSLNWETNISISCWLKSRRASVAISLTSFSFTLTFSLIGFSLWYQPIWTAMEENHISDTLLIEHGCQHSRKSKTEPAMRWATKLEKIEIKIDRPKINPLF